MTVMQKIIERNGIPYCVYVDRAGWFGGQKRQNFAQFNRACEKLEIKRALSLLERSSENKVAIIASEVGYYDQAHFTKDFNEFTGRPPLFFIKAQKVQEMSDSYNTDFSIGDKTKKNRG
jgi:AraC-like DNA-binding protein